MSDTFTLPLSLTHELRQYTVTPLGFECADCYLTIQQGEIGPRGGTSKLDVESYFVQEVDPDPEFAHVGRTFLVSKDCDRRPDIYEVLVMPRGKAGGRCTCDGWRFGGRCKHLDVLSHMVHVTGYSHGRSEGKEVATPVVAGQAGECYDGDPVDWW